MSRVAGADESYLLAESNFGLSAPIQYLWIYATDPGANAVKGLRDQLAAGVLDRRVVRARVPLARHRWVRAHQIPDVYTEARVIGDDDVSDWADTRLRMADLEPAAGAGWRLECAHTESGRLVLSLLVSHMITDGQGLYNALAAAHAGTSTSTLPTAGDVRGWAGLRGDLADSGSQVVEAASAMRVVAKELWRQRKRGAAKPTRPASMLASPSADDDAPDTTLAIVDIPKNEWIGTAKQHGGTPNGLLIAVLGGVVQRAGCPLTDDEMRICIAVNRREDGDDRANASGGVWIRIRDEIGPERGLGEIRALCKNALREYATSGNDKVADNLQPIVRLLPKKLIGKMMRSVVGPDATVSNLGVAPATSIELGGLTAESFAIRAIMVGHTAADRRRQGPAIAAWAVEYGDKVTVTIFGIHPDYFGDTDSVRKQISEELTAWGLSATFW